MSDKLKWLERFLGVWDASSDGRQQGWLCDIYSRWCAHNNLPRWSADELIDVLLDEERP